MYSCLPGRSDLQQRLLPGGQQRRRLDPEPGVAGESVVTIQHISSALPCLRFQSGLQPDGGGSAVSSGVEQRDGAALRRERDFEAQSASFPVGHSLRQQTGCRFTAPDAESA